MYILKSKLKQFIRQIQLWSLKEAIKEQKLKLNDHNISDQYTHTTIPKNSFLEYKLKSLHAWQLKITVNTINSMYKDFIRLYDVGDSSGNHIQMLKQLMSNKVFKTVSFNCDRQAVTRIKNKGLRAFHTSNVDICKWTDCQWLPKADVVVSYETLEHMTAIVEFIRRLHLITNTFLFTVPFVNQSRIGFHHMKGKNCGDSPEDLHIFELSPYDYDIILRNYGWKRTYWNVYRQYPNYLWVPLKWLWKMLDFEGFYGAVYKYDK